MQILENLAEFWKWFHEGLQGTIKSSTDGAVEVDESRTPLIGHSAGSSVPSMIFSFSFLSYIPTPASRDPLRPTANNLADRLISNHQQTGAYLAVQSALTQPAHSFRALIISTELFILFGLLWLNADIFY